MFRILFNVYKHITIILLNSRKLYVNMKEFDELDTQILELLQEPGYVSPEISKIAKRLGKAITTIHARMKRLEEKKILQGFKPIFFQSGTHIVAFMLAKIAPGTDPNDIGVRLAKIPQIEEVYFVTGEWYFLIKIRVKDIGEYYHISGETLVKQFKEITQLVGLIAPKGFK